MFFYFPAFFYALIFLAGLEIIIYSPGLFIPGIIALAIFSLWNSKKIGKRWLFLIVPTILSLSSVTLLYFIDIYAEKHLFAILSVFLYYLALLSTYRLRNYIKDQTAAGLLMASAIAAIFFFYSSSYGIYLNFAINSWVLILLYFWATFPISYQCLKIIRISQQKPVLTYSLLLGMIMAEIAWMITFWPFGYLTTGVIALIFYYALWDLIRSHFLNLLSKNRAMANIILFSFLVILILASSKWLPSV